MTLIMSALRTRKIALAVAVVLIALLAIVAFIVFGMNGRPLFDSQNIDVSSLQIATRGDTRPSISYSMTNLNSIDATSVGLSVDGVDCGQIPLLIPSGRTVSTSTDLNSITYSASKTYNIVFTVSFADGSQETYSTSFTTPVGGKAQVSSVSLILEEKFDSLHYYDAFTFEINIQNIGELSITNAQGKLDSAVGTEQTLMHFDNVFNPTPPLGMLKGTCGGYNGYTSRKYWTSGKSYSVTVTLTYSDGNKQTLQTSVVAQSR